MNVIDWLQQPMPWYVGGLLIGLMVPIMLIVVNKQLGVSSSFQHACAACLPSKAEYFNYDWKGKGMWNIVFVLGILVGGGIAANFLMSDTVIGISEATKIDLRALGLADFSGLLPSEVFSWGALMSIPGMIMLVGGGFLVGFGARYANGCTSGHAIMGMSLLSPAALVAVIGFFVGGMLITFFALPTIFSLY